ncbi:MAG: heavy metal-binding domain-containing protein [Rhodocyclaceae bacterium]|jgi:uncharacterized protein YbjQ (UPF0145 family)
MIAASHANSFIGMAPVVAILAATLIAIFWHRKNKLSDSPALNRINQELDALQKTMLLTTTDSIPDVEITKTLGYVEALSDVEVASDRDYRLAERDALLRLTKAAQAKGANAVIGIRKAYAGYDQSGSQWRISRVTYNGTAVMVK